MHEFGRWATRGLTLGRGKRIVLDLGAVCVCVWGGGVSSEHEVAGCFYFDSGANECDWLVVGFLPPKSRILPAPKRTTVRSPAEYPWLECGVVGDVTRATDTHTHTHTHTQPASGCASSDVSVRLEFEL
jgi:hypothetical protein